MTSCDVNCQKCSVTGGDYSITLGNNMPSSADPNATVIVPFTITRNCQLCRNLCIVCIHDQSGCVVSSQVFDFGSTSIIGSTITGQLTYSQPADRDFIGTISVLTVEILTGANCDDNKTFTVTTNPVAGVYYSCNQSTGCCNRDNVNGIYNSPSSCQAVCGSAANCGSGQSCNTATEIPFLGTCISKQIFFMGVALIAIYMYTKQ